MKPRCEPCTSKNRVQPFWAGSWRNRRNWTSTIRLSNDILAFSKPNHILTRLGYPLVHRSQKRFGRDSAASMFRAVNAASTMPAVCQTTG
jgi:hypothetical protein